MFKKLATAISVCVLLPICAADAKGPVYFEHHPSEPAVRPDLARIYFYRPMSALGGAEQPYITVDGYGVGVSRAGRYFYYDFPAGTHVVRVQNLIVGRATLSLTAGQTVFVRFLMHHFVPELVSADLGQAEIKDCYFDDDGMN
jgi:hypothetical protein